MAAAKVSRGAVSASIVLGVVVGLLWVLVVTGLASLGQSDAAGNAIGQAYAAVLIIALWSLLTIMTVIACAKGAASRLAKAAALVIVPVSGHVAMAAADLLARAHLPPFLWPIVIPAVVPPLAVIWCFLALLGGGRISGIAANVLPAAILAVCVLIQPLSNMRIAVDDVETARLEKYDADLARVPADAAMWDWVPFLDTRDGVKREKVLGSIRSIDQRQAQAETMLDRGDFPIGYLGFFNLDPTQSICDKARSLLRKRVEPLALATANSRPYSEIALQVSDAVAAMSWLVGHDCSCDAESNAWETMANGYSGTNYDVRRLVELRDPRELGRTLRERPERFSMLGPRSHLKAWLRFTEDRNLRDQALAGARKLDHRTGEAEEILRSKDEESRWNLFRNLGSLDLEATVPLCTNGLSVLHRQFTSVYRPGANDEPRPYSELLERLGTSEYLPALIWFARQGCAAEAELNEAIALINAYRDSPGRAEILATLTALRSQR
jgi:hypothetical protein